MAAVLITTINNYVGTAAERAAMATTGLPAGSTFYETDTKDTYIWGGAAWTVKADDVQFIAGTAIIGFTGTVNADGATKINPAKEDGNLATVATGVGAPADAAFAGGATASIIAGLKGIYTKLGAVVLAAGTAIIGKVGIDQTTPGTTNGVVLNGSNVEQTLGQAIPAKAILLGVSDGTNTQALRADSTANPNLRAAIYSGANALSLVGCPANADASSGSANYGIPTVAAPLSFNGTTWDRRRNNAEGTVLANAARTATTNSADLVNYNAKGVKVFIDVTASADTPSITVSIQEKDPIGGDYKTILTSAALTAAITAPVVLTVYPSATVVSNVAISEPLPRTWRVAVTHADGDSITYSVAYSYIN